MALLFAPEVLVAQERFQFIVSGDDSQLEGDLGRASLLLSLSPELRADPREVFGAALADYGNFVEALYANGYYGGAVSILVNRREAADIALLSVPDTISQVAIRIDPGQPFRFGRVAIGPSPADAEVGVPAKGERARSALISNAVSENLAAWREAGHAKARPGKQNILADHNSNTLSARVAIVPGPRVRFGDLVLESPSSVRENRIRRIAGFPKGEVFSPGALETVATRLRRTGAFSTVSLTEADTLGPDNSLDVGLTLADEALRRFGIGGELSSFDGMRISGFWMHRNFLGGAERFRFDAEVENIGGQTGGIDYSTGVRIESPAVFGPDTSAFITGGLEFLDEPDFRTKSVSLGIGASRIYSDEFEAEAGLRFSYSESDDDFGNREFALLSLPLAVTWDRRENQLDPVGGTYLAAELVPFFGIDGAASGLRSEIDGRAYRAFGEGQDVVLAGRFQLGSVAGPSLTAVQPDFLFYSGGGGTVRGQPYQSLNVDIVGGDETGGRTFLGLSGEVRVAVTDDIGAVAFVDTGYVGGESFFDGSGEWHSGAGIGIRYKTSLGPIRLDLAAPVSGSTGDGLQIYIGIGQAF